MHGSRGAPGAVLQPNLPLAHRSAPSHWRANAETGHNNMSDTPQQDPLFVLAHIALVLAALLLLHWRQRRENRSKQRQQALVKNLAGRRYWRVQLARPDYFARRLRADGHEGRGVLIDDGDCVRIQGHWAATGQAFELAVARSGIAVAWLGRQPPKGGPCYWGRIDTAQGPLLFAGDTGTAPHQRATGQSRRALFDIFQTVFPGQPQTEAGSSQTAPEKKLRGTAPGQV